MRPNQSTCAMLELPGHQAGSCAPRTVATACIPWHAIPARPSPLAPWSVACFLRLACLSAVQLGYRSLRRNGSCGTVCPPWTGHAGSPGRPDRRTRRRGWRATPTARADHRDGFRLRGQTVIAHRACLLRACSCPGLRWAGRGQAGLLVRAGLRAAGGVADSFLACAPSRRISCGYACAAK
jgi:hypothetical protein